MNFKAIWEWLMGIMFTQDHRVGEVVAVPEEQLVDTSGMTKAELVRYAKENDVEIKTSWSKAKIAAAIENKS